MLSADSELLETAFDIQEFNLDTISYIPNPNSVFLIEQEEKMYASTFGHSYF